MPPQEETTTTVEEPMIEEIDLEAESLTESDLSEAPLQLYLTSSPSVDKMTDEQAQQDLVTVSRNDAKKFAGVNFPVPNELAQTLADPIKNVAFTSRIKGELSRALVSHEMVKIEQDLLTRITSEATLDESGKISSTLLFSDIANSPEFLKKRKRLMKAAAIIGTGANKQLTTHDFRKLMVVTYAGFGISEAKLGVLADTATNDLIRVVRDKRINDFIPFLYDKDEGMLGFAEGRRPFALFGKEFVPEKALELRVQETSDLLLMNERYGETALDITLGTVSDKFSNLYNQVVTGDESKHIETNFTARMKQAYGKDWAVGVLGWSFMTLYLATVGGGKVQKGLTSANKALPTPAVVAKMANKFKSPEMVKKAVDAVITGNVWLATEKAIKAPVEYFSTGGFGADYLEHAKREFMAMSFFAGGLGAAGWAVSTTGRTMMNRYAETKLIKAMKETGSWWKLSTNEAVLAGNLSPVEDLRNFRLNMIGEGKGVVDDTVKIGDKTGLDTILQVSREADGLENALKTNRSKDISMSAGGHTDAMLYDASEKAGGIAVKVEAAGVSSNHFAGISELEKNLFYGAEDKVLVSTIDPILTKASIESGNFVSKYMEKFLGFGDMFVLPSRRSSIARENLDELIRPSRRITMAKEAEMSKDVRGVFASVEETDKFYQAVGWSNQHGKVATREDLITKFGMGEKDVQQYYKLKDFYDIRHDELQKFASKNLSDKGWKAHLESNLDGQGQQLAVREINIGTEAIEHGVAYTERFKKLPVKVQNTILKGIEEGEYTQKQIMTRLQSGKVKVWDSFDTGENLDIGIKFLAEKEVGELTKAVGYNPGYFGPVVYKESPVHVVGINTNAFKARQSGVPAKGKPVVHKHAARHLVDAKKYMRNNKELDKMRAEGYEFSVITSARGETYTETAHGLTANLGNLNKTDAGVLVRKLAETPELNFSEQELNDVFLSLMKPSLSPGFRNRGEMLDGKNLLGKGRTWYDKKTGKMSFMEDKRAIYNPREAALDYVHKFAQTLGAGNTRKVLAEETNKKYGQYFLEENIFNPIHPRWKTEVGDHTRRIADAKAVKLQLENIFATPTTTELAVTRGLLSAAGHQADKPGFLHEVASRGLNEIGFASQGATTAMKALGSKLAFFANSGMFFNQLAPVLDSMHSAKFQWLENVSKPLRQSESRLKRVAGTTIDVFNVDPRGVPLVTKDAMILALSWAHRMSGEMSAAKGVSKLTKGKNPLDAFFGKGSRNWALAEDLRRSSFLNEMKAMEEVVSSATKLGTKMHVAREIIDSTSFGFFYAGEGNARIFSYAAARRSVEAETKFAQKLQRKGKTLTPEQKTSLNSFQKDGTLSAEGQIETSRRATALAMGMSKENAPRAARGYIGVWAQYTATLAGNLAEKYYFGNGLSTGMKLRMGIVNASVFGSSAIPFMDDIITPFAMMGAAIQGGGKQAREALDEFKDIIAGYGGEFFGDDPKNIRKYMDGGMLGAVDMGAEAEWNVNNRIFASMLLSDFVSRNLDKVVEIKKFVEQNNLLAAAGAFAKSTPSTTLITKNLVESPIAVIEAIWQLQDAIERKGTLGTYGEAWEEGTEKEFLARDINNIKHQVFKNAPGAAKWIAFADTFGENPIWKTPSGRTVDKDDPWSTRFKLLTGIGRDYAQVAYRLKQTDINKVALISKMGYDLGKEKLSDAAPTINAKILEMYDTLAKANPMYIQYFSNGVTQGIVRNLITPKLELEMVKAKLTGRVSESTLQLEGGE